MQARAVDTRPVRAKTVAVCRAAQGMSRDQEAEKEVEVMAAKPASDLEAPTATEIAKHAVSHLAIKWFMRQLYQRQSQEQTTAEASRTTPVDTVTKMVFAHVCWKRDVLGPVILANCLQE